MLAPATIKSRLAGFHSVLSEGASISDDHNIAIEGWKARKDQLHKQQQSVTEINDEAEKVNLLSLSKQKGGK
jgi:hypothetical protein